MTFNMAMDFVTRPHRLLPYLKHQPTFAQAIMVALFAARTRNVHPAHCGLAYSHENDSPFCLLQRTRVAFTPFQNFGS